MKQPANDRPNKEPPDKEFMDVAFCPPSIDSRNAAKLTSLKQEARQAGAAIDDEEFEVAAEWCEGCSGEVGFGMQTDADLVNSAARSVAVECDSIPQSGALATLLDESSSASAGNSTLVKLDLQMKIEEVTVERDYASLCTMRGALQPAQVKVVIRSSQPAQVKVLHSLHHQQFEAVDSLPMFLLGQGEADHNNCWLLPICHRLLSTHLHQWV